MSKARRTVLITGCSAGGIGSALAEAFHNRGFHVFATARSIEKMSHLANAGMTTLSLDVDSPESIARCVNEVSSQTNGHLEILVNNAGKGYSKPAVDSPVAEAQEIFNTNFFGTHAVTQAFLPLLLKSASSSTHGHPMIVNNTSIVSVIPVPFQAMYNASKAALASLTDTLRLELEPFGINVVDLKTGAVKSQFFENVRTSNAKDTTPATGTANGVNQSSTNSSSHSSVRSNSIYEPARSSIDAVTSHAELEGSAMPVKAYADKVCADLLKNPAKPPVQIWHGTNAGIVRMGRKFLPFTAMDGSMRKMGKLDEVAKSVKARNGSV